MVADVEVADSGRKTALTELFRLEADVVEHQPRHVGVRLRPDVFGSLGGRQLQLLSEVTIGTVAEMKCPSQRMSLRLRT